MGVLLLNIRRDHSGYKRREYKKDCVFFPFLFLLSLTHLLYTFLWETPETTFRIENAVVTRSEKVEEKGKEISI